ncbi:MAG: cell envelope integrity protein CreD [Pseudomonadales bacterium]
MSRALTLKLGMIGLLVVILLILIQVIGGTVNDRQHYWHEAKANITRSWTGHQEILGPVLRIPYSVTWQEQLYQGDNAQRQVRIQNQVLYILPKTLLGQVDVKTQLRRKGIFEIPVYESQIKLEGIFEIDLEKLQPDLPEHATISYGRPGLSIGIRDARGISAVEPLQWGAGAYEFAPGSKLQYLTEGLHADLDFDPNKVTEVTFSTNLSIRGLDKLLFQPAAKTFQMTMHADWPHPAFIGSFLPRQREITADGFQAEWLTHEFSSNVHRLVTECAGQQCLLSEAAALGVEFMQPIDIYAKSERSMKYAVLFVCLVFATFFVFETLKQVPIHPIQYGLVGLAISLFYLLLVALSEHIQFGTAYAMGAIGCVTLISYYLQAVLKNWKIAAGFALWLGLVYALLYIIVSAEDLALMMGSLLLFVMLAVLMVTTRKVDWYAVGINGPSTSLVTDEGK